MRFIKIASKVGQFEEVKAVFKQARKLNLANIALYNSYITTIGKVSFEDAEEAFGQAKLRDVETYQYFIHIASRYKKTEMLSRLTQEIVDKAIVDKKLYCTLLNALVRNNLLNLSFRTMSCEKN